MRSWFRLTLASVALAAFVFVLACGGSNSSPTTPSPTPTPAPGGGGGAADVTITISGFAFSPQSANVRVGQTVAWSNADSVTHTATADNGAFDTGAIGPGQTSSRITMTTPGTFQYHCSIHPFMVATLTVQ